MEDKGKTPQAVTEAVKVEEKPSTEEQKAEKQEEEVKPEAEKPPTEDSTAATETQAAPSAPEPGPLPSQEEKKEVISESKDATSAPQITKTEEDKLTQDTTEAKAGEGEKTTVQKASDKPVTGYATEEEYKAALAEKRRQAREAKERELELERQKQVGAGDACSITASFIHADL